MQPCPGYSVLCFLSGAYPVTLPWFEKQYLPDPSPKNITDQMHVALDKSQELMAMSKCFTITHVLLMPLNWGFTMWLEAGRKVGQIHPLQDLKHHGSHPHLQTPLWGLLCRPQSGLWRLLWAQNGKIIKVDRLTTLLVSTLQSPHRLLSKMYPYSDLLIRLQSQSVTKGQLASAFRN